MSWLNIEYDPDFDIVTIEGIKYTGALFRELGGLLPIEKTFRILMRKDGVLTLQTAKE